MAAHDVDIAAAPRRSRAASNHSRSRAWLRSFVLAGVLSTAVVALSAARLEAQPPPGAPNEPTITGKPSIRLQPRYTYDNADANNDFFIARVRFKLTGEAYDVAKYYAELKLDNVGRFAQTVNAQIENAWLDFPLKPELGFRVGLYDAVFSRNALTSDSKLLVMDRSLIKDALTTLGLADNSVGLLGYGRPFGGHGEYGVGMFDNLQFEGSASSTEKQADGTMQMIRLGGHLLDPAPSRSYADYRSSYIGQGHRLSIAGNAALLTNAREAGRKFDIKAWGGDVFFNTGPFVFEGEYDHFEQEADPAPALPDVSVNGEGWYVQAGYIVGKIESHPVELASRYQERDADGGAFANHLRWTTVGVNVYIKDHALKVQSDYTFKREPGAIQNDLFQLQLQLDY